MNTLDPRSQPKNQQLANTYHSSLWHNRREQQTQGLYLDFTPGGQYGGFVSRLRGRFWTWIEVFGWIQWRSYRRFDLIAAYKIPIWLLNEEKEKASAMVTRFVHCSLLPTGQWGNEAWQSKRSRKTSVRIPPLWSWVDVVWHQSSSQTQSPANSLQRYREKSRDRQDRSLKRQKKPCNQLRRDF